MLRRNLITIDSPHGKAKIDVSFESEGLTANETNNYFRELLNVILTRAPDALRALSVDCKVT